jgi:hypothetical protein
MLNDLMVKIKESPMKNVSVEEMLKTYCLYKNEIDDFVKKSILFADFVKNKALPTQSEYLTLDSDLGSCYVRSGFDKYGKFGHPSFCISNIVFNEEFQGKGIFTVIVAIMSSLAFDKNWIFYVENPLCENFQKFLIKSGFVNNGRESIGNYFFMLPPEKLISEDEFYTLRQEMNLQQ